MTVRDSVLVIMAKEPAVGQTKTRLCPPLTPMEAAALYEAMLRDTIGLVADLQGVRLAIAVTPPEATDSFRRISPPDAILLPVAGADIGDCLDQVLGRLLADGHSQAIALNSDGPTLPAATLRQAIVRLDGADVVLGPSEDGGYYLIGLKQPRPELFRGIEWSSERVTAQTLARAEAMGLSVALLPPWYDVDTSADLDRLWAELATLPAEALPYTRRFLADGGQGWPPGWSSWAALRPGSGQAWEPPLLAGGAYRGTIASLLHRNSGDCDTAPQAAASAEVEGRLIVIMTKEMNV